MCVLFVHLLLAGEALLERHREERRRRVVEEETDKVNWLSPCTEMLQIQLISIGANILP